ncbi:MAG: hypothetical protein AB1553_06545 [Nitrospirota bacterium]
MIVTLATLVISLDMGKSEELSSDAKEIDELRRENVELMRTFGTTAKYGFDFSCVFSALSEIS